MSFPMIIAITLSILAVALFGAFVLMGAWIDGRRQKLRAKGLHPVTEPDGQVSAREFEHGSGSDDTKASGLEPHN